MVSASSGEKPNFSGSWKLNSQQSFDDFVIAQGVSWPLRQLAKFDRPSSSIKHKSTDQEGDKESCDDDIFEHKLTEAGRVQTASWLIGSNEASNMKNPLGEVVAITLQWSSDRPGVLVETHRNLEKPSRDAVMYRSINDVGQMVVEMECRGARATRFFRRDPKED